MLADLIFGRFVIRAQFPGDPKPERIQGRHRSYDSAARRIPYVQASANGKYAYARLTVDEIGRRRQRSRGPRIAIAAPVVHRAPRWLW